MKSTSRISGNNRLGTCYFKGGRNTSFNSGGRLVRVEEDAKDDTKEDAKKDVKNDMNVRAKGSHKCKRQRNI